MWITIVHFHIVFKLQLSVWVHRRKKVIYIWDDMRTSKWFILGWSVSLTAVEVTKDTMCMVNIIIKTSKARNRKKNSSHHKWQLDWPLTCLCPCKPETELFSSDRLLQSSQGIRWNPLLSSLVSRLGLSQLALCNKVFSSLSERRTHNSMKNFNMTPHTKIHS